LNEAIAASTSEQNQRMASRLVLANLLLGTCGAVAGLVAGYGIARGISRSMVQLNIPIRDATGKLSEVVGPITFAGGGDFPELKASLQQLTGQISLVVERLQHSQRDVLRAEQLAAVGQMAAGLAHELRNPLMSMKVLVQPGDDGAAVHLTGRDLAVLNEEITRLDRSIQSFLDFARPPQLEKRSFDLRPVLEQTLQLVRGRAENQGVTLHWQPPDEPVPIEADMGQVRQVVLNLLLNALDSTPQGGQVELHLERQPGPNGEWLWLQVADTGPGLPDGLGLRIFEPFVSTKETGMGLGLSICKRIVEAHGGEISAANRTEGGASFAVGLPLRPKNEDRATRNGD
jgi:two-component system sensor histidine kinase HydH